MKNIISLVVLIGLAFFFAGCPYTHRYDEGKFPYDPVNLEMVNSIYDDYNSTSPIIEGWRYLYFSSNRNSSGNDYDIVGSHFHILWDKDEGTLELDDSPDTWKNMQYVDTLFRMINTDYNEYGPYSLAWNGYEGIEPYYTDILIYSTGTNGNLDLNLAYFRGEGAYPAAEEGVFAGPKPLTILNSEYNDGYLSFYGPDYYQTDWGQDPSGITELLFCSDREGDFDIYTTKKPADTTLLDFLLSEGPASIFALEMLNSASQDKCPYVDGQLLVFTSDRPGGYGGFDLYYSQRVGNTWSDPKNFGERVNSEYNEYRPIVMMFYEFQNDLMLFSSDRPGGKGGYDLYYIGIPKMIE